MGVTISRDGKIFNDVERMCPSFLAHFNKMNHKFNLMTSDYLIIIFFRSTVPSELRNVGSTNFQNLIQSKSFLLHITKGWSVYLCSMCGTGIIKRVLCLERTFSNIYWRRDVSSFRSLNSRERSMFTTPATVVFITV